MLSKINTFLRLLVVGLLIYPMPVLADHVPTQPAYGQNLTTDNNAGTITIGILSSDGFEDSPPENYTIFFSGSSGLDVSEQTDVILRTLFYFGVVVKDPQIIQVAASQVQRDEINEKS